MKFDRILGVILSFLLVVLFIAFYNSKDTFANQDTFELIGDSGLIADNEIKYESVDFSETNTTNEEIIEFTNKENYPVTINSTNVSISCTGSSEEENDMVAKNYSIYSTFSKGKNGIQDKSMLVNPKEMIYIHINSNYSGKYYPTADVTCNYKLDIKAA